MSFWFFRTTSINVYPAGNWLFRAGWVGGRVTHEPWAGPYRPCWCGNGCITINSTLMLLILHKTCQLTFKGRRRKCVSQTNKTRRWKTTYRVLLKLLVHVGEGVVHDAVVGLIGPAESKESETAEATTAGATITASSVRRKSSCRNSNGSNINTSSNNSNRRRQQKRSSNSRSTNNSSHSNNSKR